MDNRTPPRTPRVGQTQYGVAPYKYNEYPPRLPLHLPHIPPPPPLPPLPPPPRSYKPFVPTGFSKNEQQKETARLAKLQQINIYSHLPPKHLLSESYRNNIAAKTREVTKNFSRADIEWHNNKINAINNKRKRTTAGGKVKIYTGPRNGKYIIKNGSKVYI